jgi:undecaprenyl-diphosphatase
MWERHPADTARFALAAVVGLVAVVVVRTAPDAVRGATADLVRLLDRLPGVVSRGVVGALQVAAIAAPVGAVLWLRRGRWTEVALAVGCALAAGVAAAVMNDWLEVAVPSAIIADGDRPSWVADAAFPSSAYLAATAAAVTAIGPTLTLAWRRATWWVVATVALARVLTTVEAPLNLVATVSLGVAVASAALMWFGAPSRRPSLASITLALRNGGVLVNDLQASGRRSTHGPTYTATSRGEPVFVKVVGRDERNADLLSRATRALRVKGVDDDRPVSPPLTVQHEALNALMAARAGATVPGVRAVGETDERGAYLALDRVQGTPLAELPPEEIDDTTLDAAFANLAALHRARIAHMWASAEHLLRTPDGSVCLVDMRWAELAATDEQMARDLAEMVASLAAIVGPHRATAAAARHFPNEALGATLPLVQPLALSSSTRRAYKGRPKDLASVRDAVQELAQVHEYEMAAMQRLSVRKVVAFTAALVLGNMLLGLVANFGDIWRELKAADLSYVPWMVALVAATYVSGALSLMGAVNVRLPFGRTTEIMFAQSFLNRFIPGNAGGMALRTRYLQRNGVELVVAAASVGLTSAASGVMQVVTATMFFAWAGSNAEQGTSFSLPSGSTVLVGVVLLLAVAGAVATTAFGRRVVSGAKAQARSLFTELSKLARQPSKMLLLFGGAFLGKVLNVVMLHVSLQAFGIGLPFAQVGAMYIAATTIASAAPTPGGVGAIEAALTAGLSGLGVDPAEAVAVVLFFRVLSYWLPVLPCWWALHRVQRQELV